MRLQKNLTAVINICCIIFFTASCGTYKPIRIAPIGGPDWYNSDITRLAISDNPVELARTATMLCRRNAPNGQKDYALRLAKLAYEKDNTLPEVALALSKTAFYVVDKEDTGDNIIELAELGMSAAVAAGSDKGNIEASYYYGLHLGVFVNKKGLFAIGKLPHIEKALITALARPELDMGGPQRVLGMLYLKAPAWPKGIGDLDKALEMLEQVAQKYPSFPQNSLFYAQALIEDEDYETALEYVKKAESMNVREIWGDYYYQKWSHAIGEVRKKIEKKLSSKE